MLNISFYYQKNIINNKNKKKALIIRFKITINNYFKFKALLLLMLSCFFIITIYIEWLYNKIGNYFSFEDIIFHEVEIIG